jgi:hypothetical protein
MKTTIMLQKLELATKDDIATVRKEISKSKSETIKWMFIFWIGQLAATAGIIFAFLSLYFKK